MCRLTIKSVVDLECSVLGRGKKTIAVLKASRAEMKKKSSVAFPSRSATGGLGCVMKCSSYVK